jgi:thiosulfate/3-mercaptopyruvate sulfurtransferase
LRDATLVGMALNRVGHKRWAILEGGFDKWAGEERPVDNKLPAITAATYQARAGADDFTVDHQAILGALDDKRTVIIDARLQSTSQARNPTRLAPGTYLVQSIGRILRISAMMAT